MTASFRTVVEIAALPFRAPCADAAPLFASCIGLIALLSGCTILSQYDAYRPEKLPYYIRLMANGCLAEEGRARLPMKDRCPMPLVVARLHEMSLKGDLTEQLRENSFECQSTKTKTSCFYRNTAIARSIDNPDIEDTIEIRVEYPTTSGPIEVDQIHLQAKRFEKQELNR